MTWAVFRERGAQVKIGSFLPQSTLSSSCEGPVGITVQVLLGLIVIFLGFLIARLWAVSSRGLRYWMPAWKFWWPFLSGDLKIVMSKFNEFNDWEASGLVGVGGMQAAIETVKLFDDLGLRRIGRKMDIVYHDQADGNLYESNIVCIGGPDANSVTKLILTKVDHTFSPGDPERNEVSFLDTKTGKTYDPEPGFDHGLIIKTRSPFNERRQMLVLIGNFGYGVWAAARLMSSKQFLHHKCVRGGRSFECVLRAKVIKGVPWELEIIDARELST